MKYRITTTFPVYFNGDCLPSTGYVLQVLQEGFFRDKLVDVKTFAKKRKCRKKVENASMNLKRKEISNEWNCLYQRRN